MYCSRSPVGIHHRHSQLERRLLHDWAARRNKSAGVGGGRIPHRYRGRRNLLKRKLRQTTYSPGSLCELRCRPGFQLKGQYSLNCHSTDGTWQGSRNGFCQGKLKLVPFLSEDLSVNQVFFTPFFTVIPKGDNLNIGAGSELTPSNEIPVLAPNQVSGSGFNQFRPNFNKVSLPSSTTFRPTYYQPPPPAPTFPPRSVIHPTLGSRPSTTTTTTTTPPTTTTTPTTERVVPYWTKPHPNRSPIFYSPSTSYLNIYRPVVTPSYSTPSVPTTTSRNSYIHLTYRKGGINGFRL